MNKWPSIPFTGDTFTHNEIYSGRKVLAFACEVCHWIRTPDIAAGCPPTLNSSEGERTATVDPVAINDCPCGHVSTAVYDRIVRFSGRKKENSFSKSDPGGMLGGALALYHRGFMFQSLWLSRTVSTGDTYPTPFIPVRVFTPCEKEPPLNTHHEPQSRSEGRRHVISPAEGRTPYPAQ